jgi:hypothetical protein
MDHAAWGIFTFLVFSVGEEPQATMSLAIKIWSRHCGGRRNTRCWVESSGKQDIRRELLEAARDGSRRHGEGKCDGTALVQPWTFGGDTPAHRLDQRLSNREPNA